MSLQHLATSLRQADPERFLAVMALPPAKRAPLFALYAFNLEIARAAAKPSEAMIGEMRLQWWVDTLADLAEAKPPRQHEVAIALADQLTPEQARLLCPLVKARRADLDSFPFKDHTALWQYLSDTNGVLTTVAGAMLGSPDPARLEPAGAAIGLANWLRAVPAMRAAGRHPLPDLDPQTLETLAKEGLTRLKFRPRNKADRAALLLAPLARSTLTKVHRRAARVTEGGLEPAPVMLRLPLLWQSLRL